MLPQDTLYSSGDHADEIYFIKKGRLKLYIDANEGNEEEID
jgi:CRP-like cAMP-binding protein